MVVVVPGLAEGEGREPGDVAGLVVRVEPLAAVEVAERVDRERNVLQGEDADGAAPDEGLDGAVGRPGQRVARRRGNGEAEGDPEQEGLFHESDCRVVLEVARVAVRQGAARAAQHPAQVGVGQAGEGAEAVAVLGAVRGVRVAGLVGVGVVHAVVGVPQAPIQKFVEGDGLQVPRLEDGEQSRERRGCGRVAAVREDDLARVRPVAQGGEDHTGRSGRSSRRACPTTARCVCSRARPRRRARRRCRSRTAPEERPQADAERLLQNPLLVVVQVAAQLLGRLGDRAVMGDRVVTERDLALGQAPDRLGLRLPGRRRRQPRSRSSRPKSASI